MLNAIQRYVRIKLKVVTMPKKYVCAEETCTFMSTSPTEAMNHMDNNPDHHIVEVEEDDYTGGVEVKEYSAKRK